MKQILKLSILLLVFPTQTDCMQLFSWGARHEQAICDDIANISDDAALCELEKKEKLASLYKELYKNRSKNDKPDLANDAKEQFEKLDQEVKQLKDTKNKCSIILKKIDKTCADIEDEYDRITAVIPLMECLVVLNPEKKIQDELKDLKQWKLRKDIKEKLPEIEASGTKYEILQAYENLKSTYRSKEKRKNLKKFTINPLKKAIKQAEKEEQIKKDRLNCYNDLTKKIKDLESATTGSEFARKSELATRLERRALVTDDEEKAAADQEKARKLRLQTLALAERENNTHAKEEILNHLINK